MRQSRQTNLGASADPNLSIMPYYHQRPSVPTEECFIRNMPDELLCHTLEYLAPAQGSNGLWRYRPCLPIPLVCRRWEHLFSSILYRNIGFRDTTVKQLDATLRQRPELGIAVRGGSNFNRSQVMLHMRWSHTFSVVVKVFASLCLT